MDWVNGLWQPFSEFSFMRRALVACMAISLGSAPLGVLLVLRRMSLMGDAMSHAVLPGAALGFLMMGFSVPAMSIGGFVAGLTVALLAGLTSQYTSQREDASFAAFYLISLALGVLLISIQGSAMDLMHILFGTILAVDDASLLMLASITTFTLLSLALIYRPLILECFDPKFLRAVGERGGLYHVIFLFLVVINLVAGFQALGTLMAVGLMMLPAATARFWTNEIDHLLWIASGLAVLAGYVGLLISYHADVPSGPAIILTAGVAYLISLFVGTEGGVMVRWWKQRRHLEG